MSSKGAEYRARQGSVRAFHAAVAALVALSLALFAMGTFALHTPEVEGETAAAPTAAAPTAAESIVGERGSAAPTLPAIPSTSTGSTSTSSTAPARIDVADRLIVVFGNSTDLSAGHGDEYRPLAWPAQLQSIVEDDPRLDHATVVNEAQPGSTIAAPSGWGDSPNLRLVTYLPAVLDRYTQSERSRMIALIAPSVIDLQFNAAQADASLAGLLAVLDVANSYGVGDVVVLPMNPVSAGIDEHLDLNDAVAAFNASLAELGITAYPQSPLVAPGGSDGLEVFYDDYPGTGLDGESVGADGIHIEATGQRIIAEAVAPVLLALLLTEGVGHSVARPQW